METPNGENTERSHIGVLVDAATHLRARVFALEHGRTLAELVEASLRRYLDDAEARERRRRKGAKN